MKKRPAPELLRRNRALESAYNNLYGRLFTAGPGRGDKANLQQDHSGCGERPLKSKRADNEAVRQYRREFSPCFPPIFLKILLHSGTGAI